MQLLFLEGGFCLFVLLVQLSRHQMLVEVLTANLAHLPLRQSTPEEHRRPHKRCELQQQEQHMNHVLYEA